LRNIPVLARDEITPLWRNQLQATQTDWKRARCEAAVPPPNLRRSPAPVVRCRGCRGSGWLRL